MRRLESTGLLQPAVGEMQRKLELYDKLASAEATTADGDRGRSLSQVMKNIRKRLRATKQATHPSR